VKVHPEGRMVVVTVGQRAVGVAGIDVNDCAAERLK